AAARENKLALKPTNLSFEEAAVIPISGMTALQALRDKGQVRPGDRVLIIGAGGGVGTFAVQLAKAFGADVTGVCSSSKVDLVLSIGADHVIDYTLEGFADGARQYDLIIDNAGNRPLSQLRGALAAEGTLVIVGGEGGGAWVGPADRIVPVAILSPFVRHRLLSLMAAERQDDLELLAEMAESGKFTPAVDRRYPLVEAPDAVRYVGEGHARGKVVVTI
ncbi:MAG TPA: NAD(P)-dependent alcohol dehydrogenase, partial [Acidimicrobiia bacterium]|nr:NAD(P)-dependent alcohol dehydrogenase [Acidimicrobiia bacterium]